LSGDLKKQDVFPFLSSVFTLCDQLTKPINHENARNNYKKTTTKFKKAA